MDNSSVPQQTIDTITENNNRWHRVPPLAILYYIEKLFVILLNNIFYMLPALFVLWDKIQANPWIAASIIGVLLSIITFFEGRV